MIDTSDVVGLKEEREWLNRKKRKRPKIARKRKKLLQLVLLLHPALQKHAKKKCISIKDGPLNLLSKSEETEGEELVDKCGGGSEIE